MQKKSLEYISICFSTNTQNQWHKQCIGIIWVTKKILTKQT